MEMPRSNMVSSLFAERNKGEISGWMRYGRKIRMTNMKGKQSTSSSFVETKISPPGSKDSSLLGSSIAFITTEITSPESRLKTKSSSVVPEEVVELTDHPQNQMIHLREKEWNHRSVMLQENGCLLPSRKQNSQYLVYRINGSKK
nr:hypothetical protein [Tanacetum cinerariifolium]